MVRLVTGNSSSDSQLRLCSLVLLMQPHLHSYKEAFEEMEGTSPTSPPPSGGKNSHSAFLRWVPSGLCRLPRFGSAGRVGWDQNLPLLIPMAHLTSASLPHLSSLRFFSAVHAHTAKRQQLHPGVQADLLGSLDSQIMVC